MKRKLFLVVLVAIVAMMFVACASSESAPADPKEAEAKALYAEVLDLEAKCLAAGLDKKMSNWGRAESIQFLATQYMEKKMYTAAMEPLGQAKVYYTGYLKK
ncbi:MAG: hypothetical protein RBT69_05940 [Spirochaetia bacterium]|nr:hypothetical protein [Spirochaetia bacterium]